MSNHPLPERIVSSPDVMGGKPVIKGTRLTVEYILNLLEHGASEQEILSEYTRLIPEDIRACYLFAGKTLGNKAEIQRFHLTEVVFRMPMIIKHKKKKIMASLLEKKNSNTYMYRDNALSAWEIVAHRGRAACRVSACRT